MKTVTATDTFVVDASALGKRFADERHTADYNAWHDALLAAGGRIVAPHLLRYELGNLLARKARSDPSLLPDRRGKLLEVAFVGIQFADAASIEAFAPPLSFYDAAYVALAHSLKATLVSYDDRMLAAARKAKVKTSSPGA